MLNFARQQMKGLVDVQNNDRVIAGFSISSDRKNV